MNIKLNRTKNINVSESKLTGKVTLKKTNLRVTQAENKNITKSKSQKINGLKQSSRNDAYQIANNECVNYEVLFSLDHYIVDAVNKNNHLDAIAAYLKHIDQENSLSIEAKFSLVRAFINLPDHAAAARILMTFSEADIDKKYGFFALTCLLEVLTANNQENNKVTLNEKYFSPYVMHICTAIMSRQEGQISILMDYLKKIKNPIRY
jgi:hypothetical protein